MKTYELKAKDGYFLSINTHDGKEPAAVIQLIHGMEEHQGRYEAFIHFLTQNGYCVVSSNLRGHGKNAPILGHFKDKNGAVELVRDQLLIRKMIAKLYPGMPVYLFAHSMGSVIARVLLQNHSAKYDKVVLSGYPNFRLGLFFGLPLSSIMMKWKNPTYKSWFLEKLSVGVFNNGIKDSVTPFDWLTRDKKHINKFMDDSLCGAGFSCAAFHDLYQLMFQMHQPRKYKHVNKRLSILMLSGTADPCTGGQKGTWDSYSTLVKAGFPKENISCIDYPEMRHEVLNEINHFKVFEDILDFYDK